MILETLWSGGKWAPLDEVQVLRKLKVSVRGRETFR